MPKPSEPCPDCIEKDKAIAKLAIRLDAALEIVEGKRKAKRDAMQRYREGKKTAPGGDGV